MTESEILKYRELTTKVNISKLELSNYVNNNKINLETLKKIVDSYKHNVDSICIFLGKIREKYYEN
tara:strand:+ start:235 stop:432 length:198 start_codon:yes stop_codon:yes gene_type:complete